MDGFNVVAVFTSLVILSGCQSPQSSQGRSLEKGPGGTVAYEIQVESNPPGVRIEVNQEYVGVTPLVLRLYGDRDGTFHNFGSPYYVVNALPTGNGQNAQTKSFRTGGWFAAEDMIPKRIYFDMTLPGNSGTGAAPPPRY